MAEAHQLGRRPSARKGSRAVSTLAELAEKGRKLAGQPTNLTSSADWFRIANQHGDRAELQLYGAIGDFQNGGAEFTQQLRGITASAIDLRINSPGGLVFDGVAIYSALKDHPATVDVHVDGIAASAASFIAMAGDTVEISKPGRMFIHDAHGAVVGAATDMRAMGELLESISDSIAEIYAGRAGGTTEEWRDKMRAETWFNAEQAVEARLADRIGSADARTSTPENRRGQLIMARHRARTGGKQHVR